ncbi:MAG: hypothetical protein WCL44_15115 [bacterium]
MRRKTWLAIWLCVVTLCGSHGKAAQSLSPSAPGRNVALPADSGLGVQSSSAPLASSTPRSASFLRIVTPIRLTNEPGARLAAETAQTRAILEKFRKAGYNGAIWAVDALPEKDENIQPWTEACLKAFPDKPILALDFRLSDPVPSGEKLSVFLRIVLPSVHSVAINFDQLNNVACASNPAAALAAIRQHAELVRKLAPGTFLWLAAYDDPGPANGLGTWIRPLETLANGFYLIRSHSLNTLADEAPATRALLASGKPVLRGGFGYAAPTVRPGIERDIREQYAERISRYEADLAQRHYAGYTRTLGRSVPAEIASNLCYVAQISEGTSP